MRFAIRTWVIVALLLVPAVAGASWTRLTPTGGPGNKDGPMMVYDSESDRLVLFGDHDRCDVSPSPTWVYDPRANTWVSMNPASPPSHRGHFAMAYDRQNDLVFVHGGQAYPNCGLAGTDDLWAYSVNTNTWRNMNTRSNPPMSAARPSARWGHRMVHDSAAGKLILYGGFGLGDAAADTWAYDYATNTWENRTTSASPPMSVTRPPAINLAVMGYDSRRSRTMLMGDTTAEVWVYTHVTNTWEALVTSGTPPATGQAPPDLAYDSHSDRVVFVEDRLGASGSSRTFTFHPASNTWTNTSASPAPIIHHAAMAYVGSIDRIILYGGETGGPGGASETWSYFAGDPDTVAPGTPENPRIR
jgi:galactose oxidase-like protein